MLKIKAIGATKKDKDGNVVLALTGDMPEDCIVLFIDENDMEEIAEFIKQNT